MTERVVKVPPVSLKGWQGMFDSIFRKKNQRDYSAVDLLLHIEESAAKIDEGLRKEKKSEIIKPLPHLFAWILGFVNAIGIDLERAVWQKYQGICPYCGVTENCFCISLDKKPQKWLRNTNREDKAPVSLMEWQKMFDNLYGRINKMTWSIQIWLHFHEEVGEVSEAFRLGQMKFLEEELADAFAWLIAFCNKLNVDLADIIFEIYPGICDRCKKTECECPKI